MAEASKSPTRQQLAQLRRNVAEHFNESELRTLCFDLEVDYDELAGRAKSEKAAELVAHLERRVACPNWLNWANSCVRVWHGSTRLALQVE